jgi:hypothetical protein
VESEQWCIQEGIVWLYETVDEYNEEDALQAGAAACLLATR